MTITDYAQCGTCHTRLIWAVDAHGVKLPPVNWGPDPAGTVAVQHTALGTWLGRFLAKGERPVMPEKTFSLHKCERTS